MYPLTEEEDTPSTESTFCSTSSTSSMSAETSKDVPVGLLVRCRHLGCDQQLQVRELKSHMGSCEYRPVGVCEQGCGLPILQRDLQNHNANEDVSDDIPSPVENNSNLDMMGNPKEKPFGSVKGIPRHDCITALKTHVNRQQMRISQMQTDQAEACRQVQARERQLVAQIQGLQVKLQRQNQQYKRKLGDYRYRANYLAGKATQHFIQVNF